MGGERVQDEADRGGKTDTIEEGGSRGGYGRREADEGAGRQYRTAEVDGATDIKKQT